MKKIIIITMLCIVASYIKARSYVDLGLPSGTLWCTTNESGYYTYDDAVKNFGKRIPSKEQMSELVKMCKWIWNEKGYYKVKGPNGKSIILPAAGYISKSFNPERSVTYKDYQGYYWTRTADIWDYAIALFLSSRGYSVDGGANRKHGYSVRLVK